MNGYRASNFLHTAFERVESEMPCCCSKRFFSSGQLIQFHILVFSLLGSVCSTAPLELTIVAYGSAAPMGLASLSSSTPAWELAVEDLHRKYPGSLNFSYILVPAKNCLAAAEKDGDVLAKWYYALRRPGRILVFFSTGVEIGKNWTPSSWNTVKEHDIFRSLILSSQSSPGRGYIVIIIVTPSFRNSLQTYSQIQNLKFD